MNQALYAHMNNKRKMKKKKRPFPHCGFLFYQEGLTCPEGLWQTSPESH
jgi:hypothetical protein